MKKTKLLFSVLFILTIMLVGCGKKDNTKKQKVDPEVEPKTGEAITIKLESNPSTGYSWSYDLTGDDIIVLSSEYEEGENCEGLDGCGGYEIYNLSAIGEGHVTFKLIYTLAESDDPNPLEAIYDITVDKNLKITETHSGSYFEK